MFGCCSLQLIFSLCQERQEPGMLVAKMAGKRFQADLPGAPLKRFHSCAMIFSLQNLLGHSRDGGLDPLAVPNLNVIPIRWTPPGSSLSRLARLTPTACLSVPPKLGLEVPAGAEAVRQRVQVELRTRQRCKIGSRNWNLRISRRHPRAMMAEAAAEDLVVEEVCI